MNYSSKTYAAATRILSQRREKAAAVLEKRRKAVHAKLPQLAALEREIAQAGIDVVKAIGMGENAQDYIDSLAQHNLAMQKKQTQLLLGAGFPPDYLTAQHTCKACEDKGFLDGQLCECHLALLKEIAVGELNALTPAQTCTFDTFSLSYYPTVPDANCGVVPREHMQKVLSFCRDYARQFDRSAPSLLFYGETGLGKTHLSLAIAGEVIQNGFHVIYGSTQNLMRKMERERFSNSRGLSQETEQTLLDCDLLILDDLGAEFSTQFTVACLYNIINTRLLQQLPVIISTNLSGSELESRYSRRITSRITSTYTSFLFLGNDIRQLQQR